jgi:hypothetical protein
LSQGRRWLRERAFTCGYLQTAMDEFWKAIYGKWWGKLLIACIAFGFFAWSLDVSEEKLTPTWYLEIAFNLGGRWLISGFSALCGIAYGLWGICQLLKSPFAPRK